MPSLHLCSKSALRPVPYLDQHAHLTPAAVRLLHAVSKVPVRLLVECKVYPAQRNWLHFPWYSKRSGGGAVAVVDRIHASSRFFDAGYNATDFLLLLAHEVGHLLHAEHYPASGLGRTHFMLWATGHYARSFVRNGRNWHRKARIEQEAERGRWVLRELLETSGTAAASELLGHVHGNNSQAVGEWLEQRTVLVQRLHADYPGWNA